MRKQWICVYAAFIVVSLAAGCARKPGAIDSKEGVAQNTEALTEKPTETLVDNKDEFTEFPSQYTKEAGAVHFDTRVLAGINGKVKGLSVNHVQSIKINQDGVRNNFLPQMELKETRTYPHTNEDGSEGISHYYFGEKDGEAFSTWEDGFDYYTPFAIQILNSFSIEKGDDSYNADLYQKNKDFAFSSCEEALKQVLDCLNEAGIKLEAGAYGYQCYSLDYQTMKQEESIIDMEGNQDTERYKDSWSEDDDCYYFCIRQKMDDIPVTYEYAGAFGEYCDGYAPIQAIVSKDGIQMVMLDKLFQSTETSLKAKLLEFEQVADCVEGKYGDLLTTSTYHVEQAELVYILLKQQQGGYEVKPIWVFDMTEQTEDETEEYWLQMMVDAQTGKEVVL